MQVQLGQTFKKYRDKKGYTIHQLSEILNISVGLISNIENAKTDTFQLNLLKSFITTLDIPLDEIKLISNEKDLSLNVKNSNSVTISISEIALNDDVALKDSVKLILSSYLNLISSYKNKDLAIKLITNHMMDILNSLYELKQIK